MCHKSGRSFVLVKPLLTPNMKLLWSLAALLAVAMATDEASPGRIRGVSPDERVKLEGPKLLLKRNALYDYDYEESPQGVKLESAASKEKREAHKGNGYAPEGLKRKAASSKPKRHAHYDYGYAPQTYSTYYTSPQVYTAPVHYSAPVQTYSAPAYTYSAPAYTYSAPAQTYSVPAQTYSAPVSVQHVEDTPPVVSQHVEQHAPVSHTQTHVRTSAQTVQTVKVPVTYTYTIQGPPTHTHTQYNNYAVEPHYAYGRRLVNGVWC